MNKGRKHTILEKYRFTSIPCIVHTKVKIITQCVVHIPGGHPFYLHERLYKTSDKDVANTIGSLYEKVQRSLPSSESLDMMGHLKFSEKCGTAVAYLEMTLVGAKPRLPKYRA